MMQAGQSSALERACPPDYLARLAASGHGRAYKSLVLAQLAITAGGTVLDLGCGPGTDLAALAAAAGPAGTVIGIDHDEQAVSQARARTIQLANVRVELADIHSVALPDGSADRIRADRVLQHATDVAAVLAETRRMLRADGRAVFAEPDWDTLIIDYPEPAVSQGYRRFITDRVVRNALIGRQLPRIAGQAGLTVNDVIPVTSVFRNAAEADKILGFYRVTARAVAAGYLTDAAASGWLSQLSDRALPFFAAVTLFVTVTTPAS